MARPLQAYRLVQTFQVPNVLPQEPFHFNGKDYLGVQSSSFESSEDGWDNGDPAYGQTKDNGRGYGRWMGQSLHHIFAASMRIIGCTFDSISSNGSIDIAKIDSGTGLSGGYYVRAGEASPLKLFPFQNIIQRCSDGTVLMDAVTTPLSLEEENTLAIGDLADGSYLWFSRVSSAAKPFELPPDYFTVTGYSSITNIPQDYKYNIGNELRIWDWKHDVGIRPDDVNQLSLSGKRMWEEYYKLVSQGTLENKGEWTTYITGSHGYPGEWSCLRFHVGAGDFTCPTTLIPALGPSLYRLDTTTTRTALPFDPLTSSLNAWEVEGAVSYIAGTLATRSGAGLALWKFSGDESWELQGFNSDVQGLFCEASLHPEASDIIRQKSGRLSILTIANLHYFDEDVEDLGEKLPGNPKETKGHPGGRCLREFIDELLFYTENFSVPHTFYNRLQQQSAGRRSSGEGTVFHGNNCADVIWSGYWGIHQASPFGEGVLQYIAYHKDGVWIDNPMEGFDCNTYRWQRMRTLANKDGIRMLLTGKRPDSPFDIFDDLKKEYAIAGENAIWGVFDGINFQETYLPFRVRRMTRCPSGNFEEVYCIGRFVEDPETATSSISTTWSVIALTGDVVKFCANWDSEEGAYIADRSDAEGVGLDYTKLPAYLWFIADSSHEVGGYWQQESAAPTDSTPYLQLIDDPDFIIYKDTGLTVPYDTAIWGQICFIVLENGGTSGPFIEASCTDAACALAGMPDGTKQIIFKKDLGDSVWTAIQVNDVSDISTISRLRKLEEIGKAYPNLWMQTDSSLDPADLSTYDRKIYFNQILPLASETTGIIRCVVFVTPDAGKVRKPVIEPRN